MLLLIGVPGDMQLVGAKVKAFLLGIAQTQIHGYGVLILINHIRAFDYSSKYCNIINRTLYYVVVKVFFLGTAVNVYK